MCHQCHEHECIRKELEWLRAKVKIALEAISDLQERPQSHHRQLRLNRD